MKKLIAVLPLALTLLGACSRNPDPEYAPENDDADAAAAVAVEAEVAPGPGAVAAPAPAPVAPDAPPAEPNVPEERAMLLGREAVAMLYETRIDELWPRFDSAVHTMAGSAAAFADMTTQIFGQTGPETAVVEEDVFVPPENAELTVYRRRSHYLLTGEMDVDLYIVFNADESIGGVNIRPAEEE